MKFLLVLLCLSVAPVLLNGQSCGRDVGDKGVGEPCTRDSECGEELSCMGGTCERPADGGTDGG